MRKQALISLIVTVFLHASVAGGVAAVAGWGGDGDEPEKKAPERQIMTIEASLAYKSEKPSELPQKERKRRTKKKAPKKAKKAPKIVPRDPNQTKPEKTDDTEEEDQEDLDKKFKELMEQRQAEADDEQDDSEFEESDTDVQPAGTFDGSKHGFAEVSRGDPYMRTLAADVYNGWELTSMEKESGEAIGCVRLDADGSVLAVDLWKKDKTNSNLNLSVNNALDAVKKKRKPGAAPVPAHLMDATRQWICFKFSVTQGS